MSVADKIKKYVEYSDVAALCTEAFAEPGRSCVIDFIHPDTGLTLINAETLEQVRKRYPTAKRVNIEEWQKAKAAKQDEPVTWSETTEEKYVEMLEVLPPAFWRGSYFLVGEPVYHHALSGMPCFQAFGMVGEGYVQASRPMTVKELKAFLTGRPN